MYVLAWLFVQSPPCTTGFYLGRRGESSNSKSNSGGDSACGRKLLRRLKRSCPSMAIRGDMRMIRSTQAVCCYGEDCTRKRLRQNCGKW